MADPQQQPETIAGLCARIDDACARMSKSNPNRVLLTDCRRMLARCRDAILASQDEVRNARAAASGLIIP